MKAPVLLLVVFAWLAWAPLAGAAPVRILIAAGARTGLPGDRPLSHPNNDAAGVRDVLASLGGVRGDTTIFLPDASRAALLSAIGRAEAIARRHTPDEVTLIVYFSGHGDRDALHIDGESLSTAELSSRIAAVPARLQLVIVDACRTTAPSSPKGMKVEPGFGVSLSAPPAPRGSAWLYASSDGEAAQESNEMGGAIFTHFWLAGLRGAADTNGDERVTLGESFAYAHSQTLLRSTRSGAILQRPEARLDLTESSPLVLTELRGERAQLEFPRDADALYLVYALGAQTVIAEVYGVPDRTVRVVLPTGRYIIQRRSGARGAAVDVLLRPESTHALAAEDFRPFEAEQLSEKGGLVVRPWSVELVDSLMTGSKVDLGDDLSIRVARRETWGIAIGPLAGMRTWHTAYNAVTERYVGGEASVDRFFTLAAPLLLRLGVDLRGEWISQTVKRNDRERAQLAGFSATNHHTGTALGGGLHAGLRLAVTRSLYVDLAARALALGNDTLSGLEVRVLGGALVGVGLSL